VCDEGGLDGKKWWVEGSGGGGMGSGGGWLGGVVKEVVVGCMEEVMVGWEEVVGWRWWQARLGGRRRGRGGMGRSGG
jgi:hypothetical protein